jgi:hypothetical protein
MAETPEEDGEMMSSFMDWQNVDGLVNRMPRIVLTYPACWVTWWHFLADLNIKNSKGCHWQSSHDKVYDRMKKGRGRKWTEAQHNQYNHCRTQQCLHMTCFMISTNFFNRRLVRCFNYKTPIWSAVDYNQHLSVRQKAWNTPSLVTDWNQVWSKTAVDVNDIHDMTKCMTVCSKEKEGDGKLGVDIG